MRRRRPSRILALPLSLWFVVLTTDAGDVDACPMHHMVMAGHSAMATAHGSMSMARMMPAPTDPTTPDSQGPMQCRCIGTCCGGSLATLPTSTGSALAPTVTMHHGVDPRGVPQPRAAAAPHRQPPSVGPPPLHTV